MKFPIRFALILLIFLQNFALAKLTPQQILILANSKNPDSIDIAKYYAQKRNVPPENILTLDLPQPLVNDISRQDYEKLIAQPVKQTLTQEKFKNKIKCILTTYGIPYRVGPREMLADQKETLEKLESIYSQKFSTAVEINKSIDMLGRTGNYQPLKIPASVPELFSQSNYLCTITLKRLKNIPPSPEKSKMLEKWLTYYAILFGKEKASQIAQNEYLTDISNIDQMTYMPKAKIDLIMNANKEKWPIDEKLQKGYFQAVEDISGLQILLTVVESQINNIKGIDSQAALDSELSMVMFEDYDLYRWQINELKDRTLPFGIKTIMVSRLDGPTPQIVKGLIDKAISAEENGLQGKAYFDSQGLPDRDGLYSKGYFDKSIQDTALLVGSRTNMPVITENTVALFQQDQCPDTAIYCGWYSLQNYIDSFTFVDGAVGYHIASWEAVNLRDPQSDEWCPSMLKNGITATIGSVAEPFLRAFPEPRNFFNQLLNGGTIVEAYYKTKPYNSWQIILIADPLYQPFKK